MSVATPQDSVSVLSSESSYIEQDLAGLKHLDLANENMISVEEYPVSDDIPLFTEGVTHAPSQPGTSVHSNVLAKLTVTAIPTSTVSTTTVSCASITLTTSTVTGAVTSTGFADPVPKSRPLSTPPGLEKPKKVLTLGSLSVKPKVKDLKGKKKKTKSAAEVTTAFLQKVKASSVLFGQPSPSSSLHDLPVQAVGPVKASGSVVKVISIQDVSPPDTHVDPSVSVVDQIVLPPRTFPPRMFCPLPLSR